MSSDKEGPDEPLYPRSLIRTLAVRKHNHWILQNGSLASKYPDATLKFPLQKHAYSNKLKNSPPKTGNFQIKNSDIFHISAQNRKGEAVLTSTHNLCFLTEIRKIMYTPVNPSFTT